MVCHKTYYVKRHCSNDPPQTLLSGDADLFCWRHRAQRLSVKMVVDSFSFFSWGGDGDGGGCLFVFGLLEERQVFLDGLLPCSSAVWPSDQSRKWRELTWLDYWTPGAVSAQSIQDTCRLQRLSEGEPSISNKQWLSLHTEETKIRNTVCN